MAFEFDGIMYFEASFLKEKVPTYFYGCSATINKIIEKKNIPINEYIFASYSKVKGWKLLAQDSIYNNKKLLITKKWVEGNVPGFIKVESKIPIDDSKYKDAPNILYLEENEMFKDEQGQMIDIEVRGERHPKKIWFKARDVGKMFNMDSIRTTLQNSQTQFTEGMHFQTFIYESCVQGVVHNEDNPPNKKQLKASIFLSYLGLLRLLFVRQHPIADKFQEWASEKLFAIQYGTLEQKNELAADVMGVSVKAIKAFLNTNVNSMPVIYLFSLGKVKELRTIFNIPESFDDDQSVYKYGLTRNFKKRTEEHERAFSKFGIIMTLKYHVYIDPLYLQNAENDIGNYFKIAAWHLNHPKFTELVCLQDQFINNIIHNEFQRLGQSYAGKLGFNS